MNNILDIVVRAFSAVVWRLESIRCRWQTEAAHAEAEHRQQRREQLTADSRLRALQCPQCYHLAGVPPGWPTPTPCPMCGEALTPFHWPAIDTLPQ